MRYLVAVWMLCGVAWAGQNVEARIEGKQVVVTVEGKLLTAYKFDGLQKYPYFFPVNGPASGQSVTTETSEPYPHHHSLFLGCDRVNGGNYWQEGNERGQIVSQGPVINRASGQEVVFTDTCLWAIPGQEPVMRDQRVVHITAPNERLRLIDFEILLEPLVNVVIEKTNHSLFSARMAPELSVEKGGTLVNAEGKSGEEGTFGAVSPWCDYFGTRDGVTEGLAILQHPGSRWYPVPWFTRNYGFLSPTPMYWLEGDKLELEAGQVVRLQYRVAVHAGDTQAADVAGLFEQYAGVTDGQLANVVDVRVEGDTVRASQGRDETLQEVSVRVWGPRFEEGWRGFRQLDDDMSEEYCFYSRTEGSGPYFKLQVIDFVPQGILTWSYDSYGEPKFEGGDVLLGDYAEPGGATPPIYARYGYTAQGLVPR